MQTKDFSLSVKDVSEEGTFEGYASTFGGAPDSYGDVVMPGAFSESLVKHKREGTMPLLLWGHNSSELPIGNWVDMAEDGKGLWGKAQIDLDDPVGLRVHKALKRKSVRGLSIGYQTILSEQDKKKPGVTNLQKLDIWEVSVVNFPANRRSLVDSVKSGIFAGRVPTERELEQALGELGLSKRLRVAIASKAKPLLIRSDSQSDAADEAKAFLQRMLG